jgi:hypothetical protein
MRQGKSPTRRQKIFLQKKRMNPADWLVVEDTQEKMVLQHRHFDSVKKIVHKGERENA